MPKELTHWIVAEEALKALPYDSRLKTLLKEHHDCYLGGAVLPDTLLHLFRGEYAQIALSLANNFHDCPGNCFAPLIALEENRAGKLPDADFACLLGIIAHCQADSVFHPFVYSQAGDDMGKHYALETTLDVYLQQNGFPSPCKLLGELLTPGSRECILRLCAELFDPQHTLPSSMHEQALAVHIRFQARYDNVVWKLLATLLSIFPHTSLGRKSRLFYPLFHGESVDIPGEGSWKHPVTGEQHHTSCLDLLHVVVERTSLLFQRIEANDCSLSVLNHCPGENLLTGLPSNITFSVV